LGKETSTTEKVISAYKFNSVLTKLVNNVVLV